MINLNSEYKLRAVPGVDNAPALQAAMSSRDTYLKVEQAGEYEFSRPCIWKSNIHLEAVPGVIFKNVADSGADPLLRSHIVFGDAHPYAFDARNPAGKIWTNVAVGGDLVAGQQSIKFPAAANVSLLREGQWICLRTTAEYLGATYSNPDLVQFVKIHKVSGRDVILDDPVEYDMVNALAAVVLGIDPYLTTQLGDTHLWAPITNASINGITFKDGNLVFNRGFAVDCQINDCNSDGVASFLAMNALIRTTIKGGNVDWATRAIEIKMGSRDTSVENIVFSYNPVVAASSSTHPWSVGERSRRITFDNLNINIPASWNVNIRPFQISDTSHFTLRNSDITLNGGGAGAEMIGLTMGNLADVDPEFQCTDIFIADNTFVLGIENARLARLLGAADKTITNVHFSGNHWSGTPTTAPNRYAYWAEAYVLDWDVTGDTILTSSQHLIGATSEAPDPNTVNWG